MRHVVIIGGGLAGLIASIQLIRAGIACTVIEKKSYPLHRVCGEYVSNEALPFLRNAGLYPAEADPPQINTFELTSVHGRGAKVPLDLGGFGISRFTFDHHLFLVAKREGVHFVLNTEAVAVDFSADGFGIKTTTRDFFADVVVGSFGKRSRIDVQQRRAFLEKRSPFVGVKYHVRTDHPPSVIALHNFPGGYCGVCHVEKDVTNLCYLTHRDNLRRFGDIRQMEREVLYVNSRLREIFSNSDFLFDRPEVINEISFETKGPVENHLLMAGDAAGMITPACGNGMAIAIHSGQLLSGFVQAYCEGTLSREKMEVGYQKAWNEQFRRRLWIGRQVQRLFGRQFFSSLAVNLAERSPSIATQIVSRTHGKPF